MKIRHFDKGEGELKVEPQSLEDLWYLMKIVEPGDKAKGHSFRLWKPQDALRPGAAERKPVKIEIRVEKVEFAQAANKLRLTGTILAGEPEDFCPRGEHHTLDTGIGETIEVKKEFNPYHEAMLEEAKKRSKHLKVIVLVIDEEKGLFAELETKGIVFGVEIHNNANKRDPKSFDERNKKYFETTASELDKRAKTGKVLVAGPGFAKDNLKKLIDANYRELAKRVVYEHAGSAETTAVVELLKRGLLQRLMTEQKLQDEFEALEKFKTSLGRNDGLSVYGENVSKVINTGAVSEFLVLDEKLRKDKIVQAELTTAKKMGAKITIFNSEDEAGMEFKSFKVAVLLRYRVDWE
ncbi:MAG: mRNA surveillance protein pelota [Candidatus Micrarchaeota archaeon]